MRKAFFNLLLCTLFAFACLRSYGQQGLNFTSLTTKNGLSSNAVNAVFKDSYGWVWFATGDGLNRFDGTNFTVYRHVDGDTTSLPVNEILSLYEDWSGRLRFQLKITLITNGLRPKLVSPAGYEKQ